MLKPRAPCPGQTPTGEAEPWPSLHMTCYLPMPHGRAKTARLIRNLVPRTPGLCPALHRAASWPPRKVPREGSSSSRTSRWEAQWSQHQVPGEGHSKGTRGVERGLMGSAHRRPYPDLVLEAVTAGHGHFQAATPQEQCQGQWGLLGSTNQHPTWGRARNFSRRPAGFPQCSSSAAWGPELLGSLRSSRPGGAWPLPRYQHGSGQANAGWEHGRGTPVHYSTRGDPASQAGRMPRPHSPALTSASSSQELGTPGSPPQTPSTAQARGRANALHPPGARPCRPQTSKGQLPPRAELCLQGPTALQGGTRWTEEWQRGVVAMPGWDPTQVATPYPQDLHSLGRAAPPAPGRVQLPQGGSSGLGPSSYHLGLAQDQVGLGAVTQPVGLLPLLPGRWELAGGVREQEGAGPSLGTTEGGSTRASPSLPRTTRTRDPAWAATAAPPRAEAWAAVSRSHLCTGSQLAACTQHRARPGAPGRKAQRSSCSPTELKTQEPQGPAEGRGGEERG